jgi:hypothetical protein
MGEINMADLFSDEWMKSFMDAWNKEPELSDALAKIDFDSVIGYGFQGDDGPTGVITVEKGKVTAAGAYNGESLSWDIRAKPANWEKWLNKGVGMAGLGMAYTTGKMKFVVGDYMAMVKDPRMAGPFIKSFSVMGTV